MILIKDDSGKPNWINPDLVCAVKESYFMKYVKGDNEVLATEVWFGNGFFTIEAPFDEVMSALKPRVRA